MFQVPTGWRVQVEVIRVDLARDARQRLRQHARTERGRRRIRRQIDLPVAVRLVDRHEGSPALDAAREAPALQDGIGLRHGAQADLQRLRQVPMGRQAIAAREPPLDDVVGQGQHHALGGIRAVACQTGRPGGSKEHVRGLANKSVM
ncbi:hypothetical protein D9M68_759000 [compost metagenome]